MKVTIEIDCTPQEARAFFGLPDLEPLQEQLVAQLQDQLSRNLGAFDPEAILRSWLPNAIQGVEGLRKMFGGALARQGSDAESGLGNEPASKARKKKAKRRASR